MSSAEFYDTGETVITAVVDGKQGWFTLQHSGLMDKGAPSLAVVVVPDPATEGLSGLTETISIVIELARHDHQFHYTLPD